MSMKRVLSIALVLLVAVLAAACQPSGGAASPTAAPANNDANSSAASGSPTDAAKSFFDAIYKGEDASAFVCSEAGVADVYQQAAEASAANMPDSVTVNTDGLTYTASDETAESATVTVEGSIVFTVSGVDTPVPLAAQRVRIVNEGGTWKFCGGAV